MIDIKIINNANKVNFISNSNLEAKIYLKSDSGYKELLDEFSFIGTYEYTPTKDGLYSFEFSNENPTCKTVQFDYYRNYELRNSFLDSIDKIVCEKDDCNCSDCDDCEESEKVTSLLKALSYYYLQNPLLFLYQQSAFVCLSNLLSNINSCILLNEKILGKSENEELLKLILAYHYYIIYKYELDTNVDKDWVKTTYRETTTLQCIKDKTNLSTDCIDSNLDLFLQHTTLNNLKEKIILDTDDSIDLSIDESENKISLKINEGWLKSYLENNICEIIQNSCGTVSPIITSITFENNVNCCENINPNLIPSVNDVSFESNINCCES